MFHKHTLIFCLDRCLEPELPILLSEEFDDSKFNSKFKKLNSAIATMVSLCKSYSFHKYALLHEFETNMAQI